MMAGVIDNPIESRFEMPVDGGMAFVTYRRAGAALVLNHAEVPRELEGRGVGSALVKATLDAIRLQGRKVVPRCPFIAAYIRRHPEYADLLQ